MHPLVAIIMGSQTDWEVMQHTSDMLQHFRVPFEKRIVSAHRTPDWLFEFAENAQARGLQVIIAGAGGAAHLPGMTAAKTIIPILGVPVPVGPMNGQDALWSMVQMPAGVPVGTLAIGKAGAINAALLALQILALKNPLLSEQLMTYRHEQARLVREQELP